MPGSGYTSGLCVCVCVCVQSIVLYLCPSDRCGVGGLQRAAQMHAPLAAALRRQDRAAREGAQRWPMERSPRRCPSRTASQAAAALSAPRCAPCPAGSRTGRLEKIRQEKIGFEGLSQSRFLAPCPSSEPERKPGTPPNCHTAARCWRLQPGAAITSSKPWEYGAWRALRRCQSPRLSSA